MKKLLSMLMAFIMLVSCIGMSTAVQADELDNMIQQMMQLYNSAATIKWDSTTKSGSHSVTINSQASVLTDYMAMLKFKPTTTGWYEFSMDKMPETGVISFEIASEDMEEEIYAKSASAGTNPLLGTMPISDLKTGAKLKAGNFYFIIVMGSETGVYTADLKVKMHKHVYGKAESMPAYCEYDETYEDAYLYNENGGKFQECKNCTYRKTVETYYAPKSMTLSYTSCAYNAKQRKPSVTIKDKKGNKISSSNYTVRYRNNIKPGKATVTVTFKGSKYAGEMTKVFIIKPKKATLSSVKSTAPKKLTVKWKKDANATGYQIAYSTSTKFTKSTTKYAAITKAGTVSKTITGLKGGKKYSVKVRAYKTVDGKKQYGAWSSCKTVTVRK